MALGETLSSLRKAKGLSQEQLAEELGLTRQTISKWECNQSTPDLEYLVQLSDFFAVSADYLIKGEQIDKTPSSNNSNFEEQNIHSKDMPNSITRYKLFVHLGSIISGVSLIWIIVFVIPKQQSLPERKSELKGWGEEQPPRYWQTDSGEKNLKKLVILNATETAEISNFAKYKDEHSHQWLDENGWDERTSYVMTKDGTIYPVTLHIAKARDGRNILYDVNVKIKEGVAVDKNATSLLAKRLVGQAVKTTMPSYKDIVPQISEKSSGNVQCSLSAEDDIAPIYGNYNVYGKDIALENGQDDIAPVMVNSAQKDIAQTRETPSNDGAFFDTANDPVREGVTTVKGENTPLFRKVLENKENPPNLVNQGLAGSSWWR